MEKKAGPLETVVDSFCTSVTVDGSGGAATLHNTPVSAQLSVSQVKTQLLKKAGITQQPEDYRLILVMEDGERHTPLDTDTLRAHYRRIARIDILEIHPPENQV